nr:pollen-specific leucine-rich repeat extensin-like protein 2 isoform X2 [Bombyx mori]
MSNGSLPQWKRELLQRRAARSRVVAPPAAPPPPPPPPPPPADDEDEELRYGPGIVKRLKSRYLSLALRDAPRRRPSVLRRATSLEHLLDERPPPTPAPRPVPLHCRPPRPVSVAAPPVHRLPTSRRDSVKRARSVDALSRLDRDEPPPPSPSPPPPPLCPRPTTNRTARPPRRPTPLLRETERPPPDLVRSTLRKFESTPTRRIQPAVRVSAVLRGLETPPRTSTPEPAPTKDQQHPKEIPPRSPSPPLPVQEELLVPEETESHNEEKPPGARLVSRTALEEIARAGSSTRYSFEAPRVGSHLPPLAATNPVLVGKARRIGVIRPMPALSLNDDRVTSPAPSSVSDEPASKIEESQVAATPPPPESEQTVQLRPDKKEPPPSAIVEPIPRALLEPARVPSPRPQSPITLERSEMVTSSPLMNGHSTGGQKPHSPASKIGSAGIERAWSGSAESASPAAGAGPWGAQRKTRAPPPSTTSVVFNFSDRKEVPDYIENDGIILRGSRRNRIKAGEPGIVVLRPEALTRTESEEEDEADCGPPSPCGVRFVNDNVLINGKSSMPNKPNRDRIAKLKLQFDDSLTRTFEYPSETSMCEESPAPAPLAASAPLASLADNTHIASGALCSYTPSKTPPATFQLGLTRPHDEDAPSPPSPPPSPAPSPAPSPPHCWTRARSLSADLLF